MRNLYTFLVLILLAGFVASPASAQDNFMAHVENDDVSSFISSVSAAGATVNRIIQLDGTSIVCFSGDRSVKGVARELAGAKTVADDPTVQWHDPSMQVVDGVGTSFGNPPNSGDDDGLFDLQWGHDAVNATEAWRKNRGAGVRVAVLDSGIDAEHPDIAPNLNTALSYSFVPGEDWNIQPGFAFNHGTHVAGTIGAADNGIGTIGVAPEVELVALKVLSEFTGSGDFSWLIEGIVYAAENGVDIANMSLGGLFPKAGSSGAAGRELKEILDAVGAYANDRGLTLIAAAGNTALNIDDCCFYLPSGAKHFISVSATAPIGWALDPYTNLDIPTSYTNHGSNHVDFAGPGGDALYLGDEDCVVAGIDRPCWVFDLVFSTIGEGWGWAGGTSMATPHVAGVAAMIKGWKQGATPEQIKDMIKASADKLGDTPGNDTFFGQGRVNAQSALGLRPRRESGVAGMDKLALSTLETPTEFNLDQNHPNPFNPTTMLNFAMPQAGHVTIKVYNLLGKEVATLVNETRDAGNHVVSFDGAGLSSGVYLYTMETAEYTATRRMTLLK